MQDTMLRMGSQSGVGELASAFSGKCFSTFEIAKVEGENFMGRKAIMKTSSIDLHRTFGSRRGTR